MSEIATRKVPCQKCRGTGKILNNSVFEFGWKTCPDCQGKGYIEYKLPLKNYTQNYKRRFL